MPDKRPTMIFKHRGRIERGTGNPRRPYRWREAYSQDSNGRPTYPWGTRAECREEAERAGCKAVFEMELVGLPRSEEAGLDQ